MNMAKGLTGGRGRVRGRLAGAMAIATLLAVGSAAQAVIITPTFDSSITSSAYAGSIESAIDSALNFYDTNLSNPIHVNIYFTTTGIAQGALGESLASLYTHSYSTYTQALIANGSANPGNSVAQIANSNLQYGNDSNGAAPIIATSANMRALGFSSDVGDLNSAGQVGSGTGYIYDGIIILGAANLIGFSGSGTYSANRVIQHEVDEVLGIGGQGSQVGNTGSTGYGPMDLYRYSAVHTPSFTTSATATPYFSIDGGSTNLVSFNQNAAGDYGDWGGNTNYVQQAFTAATDGAASVSITSPEGIALQAIGYDALPPAPSLIWAPNGGASGHDYPGYWDTTSFNWNSSGGNVVWTNGDGAVFGAGTDLGVSVIIQSAVTAQSLIFNAGGPANGYYYTISSGSGDTLTMTGANITVNSNDLISAPVDFTNGLVLSGAGILTLTATNTNSSGTFLLSGTLAISRDAALGTGGLTFSGGTLQLDNYASSLMLTGSSIQLGAATGTAASLLSVITGTSALMYEGPGVLNLDGQNTYTGATTINAGTLALAGTGSIADSATVALTTGAIFDISQSTIAGGPTIASLTGSAGTVALGSQTLNIDLAAGTDSFGGVIQDGGINNTNGGSLALTGVGTLALSAINTYTGPTLINSGTLALVGTGSIADSSAVTLSPGATFDISQITPAGGAVISGLAGTGGTVALGSQILTVDVASGVDSFGGTLADGGIGGGTGGQLVKAGAGTLSLTAPSTYTGATTVAAGTLALAGNGGVADSSLVNIAAGATFDVSGSSIAGGPVVNNIIGTGAVTLGSNTLTVAPNNTDIFAGAISGTGNLTVGGSGSLTLAGASTYSGITTINTGSALLVNGLNALGSSSVVNNGMFGNVSSQYTANIQGGFTQSASGVLVARVGGQQAGQFDQFNVGGNASISGNLSVVFQNNYAPLTSPVSLTIIKATGGLSGNFSSINLGAHPIDVFANTVVSGTDLNLILTLVQPSLIPYALTPNQIAVATYLNATDGYNGGSHPSPEYQALINSIDSAYAGQIPGILDQLSPIDLQAFPQVAIQNGINLDQTFSQYAQTIDTGARGLNTSGLMLLQPGEDSPNQAALGQMLQSQADVVSLDNNIPAELPGYLSNLEAQARNLSHPAPTTNWGAFVTGAAQFDDFSNTGSISSPNITTADVTAGIDYHIAQPLAVGVLFNYAHSFLTLDPYNSKGSVNSYTPGVYANLTKNGWFVDGLAAYTYSSNSETRNITAGPFSGAANGNFSGNAINGSIDLGKQIYSSGVNFSGTGGWTLVPMVSLGYTHADFSSFSETGAGAANLNVQSFSTDSFRTVLSTTFLYRIVASPNMAWTPGLTLGWRHEYLNDSQGITSQLQGAGTGGFTINTESPSRDVAIIAPSLSVTINRNISAFVDYELDVGSSNFHAQQVFAGVAVAF